MLLNNPCFKLKYLIMLSMSLFDLVETCPDSDTSAIWLYLGLVKPPSPVGKGCIDYDPQSPGIKATAYVF